jgi:hypothetical protein
MTQPVAVVSTVSRWEKCSDCVDKEDALQRLLRDAPEASRWWTADGPRSTV